ncbi:MAG: alanine/glycine:cation symporter family protein [Bacteroidales bacterium]|jgi:AGCS family alanine or glycine:cation symporter|nr:alanine/glycine:cation symporter family protein [Bacteroidales bacterium]HHV40335.1 alanine:cation symporter family protein [Bacteroidales bacterium]
MQDIQVFFSKLSSLLWGWPMIILLLGTHVFLTIRLKFPQRKIFKGIALSVKSDGDSEGDVSQFGALATALAATIGTGNIIGVATAVSLGGPGAVLWCWLSGVFGIATKYAEGLLAVKYRVTTSDGTMMGGPMYALERGLGAKWLAVLFCIFTVLAALGIGCSVQSNSISTMLYESFNVPIYVSGAITALLVALVIFFGIKGIANVCGFLVPFMAFFYVAGCIVILAMNASFLGSALSLIFKSAFTPQAIGGGFVGGGLMVAMRYGIARGLFSNESGMGSAPIVAAAARTKNPVRQALVSATGTFWDTVIVCAMTGLVLVTSILRYPDIDYKDGALLTKLAFSKIKFIGPIILNVGLITFAFSTILGWAYYAEKAIEYLGGKKVIFYYRILWVAVVFIGSVVNLSMVWDLADAMNALMAIPNLISLLLLTGVLVKETNKYLWSDKLDAEAF